MEESPSETYSKEYVEEIKLSLDWHAAILAVLLQEAGGAVEVAASDLATIDLSKARASVSHDMERDVYIIKGLYEDES